MGGKGVKIGQNLVHVVVECPLMQTKMFFDNNYISRTAGEKLEIKKLLISFTSSYFFYFLGERLCAHVLSLSPL